MIEFPKHNKPLFFNEIHASHWLGREEYKQIINKYIFKCFVNSWNDEE